MRRLTEIKCEDCGAVVVRRWHNGKARVCHDCGLERHLAQTRDMAARSGPYYERWLAATGRTPPRDGQPGKGRPTKRR